jgi:GDPmannose 4,6-dehydratase
MWRMLQQDYPDDFIVAQGESHSVRDFVVAALRVIGIDNWEDYVQTNPDWVRPTEIRRLIGDATKAHRHLAWAPTTDFQTLVKVMVDAEREVLTKR